MITRSKFEVIFTTLINHTDSKFSHRSVLLAILTFLTLLMSATTLSHAAIDVYDFDSDRQEAQYRGLIEEFRCPKCQNENLASSNAPIAQDLKQKTYDMVKDGRSDAEIRQYMQERYGDFISYDPPVRPSTWILWFFPPLLLLLILGFWFWRNNSKSHARINTARNKARSNVNKRSAAPASSALNAEEQAALDKLLASRTASGEKTSGEAESAQAMSAETTVKPDSTKPNVIKPNVTKPNATKAKQTKLKPNKQTRNKGEH